MSAGNPRAAAATPPRLPLFGVEMEIYVKLKPKLQVLMWEKRRTNPDSLPEHWRNWNHDLRSDYPKTRENIIAGIYQRREVGRAVMECIDKVLGPNNGWRCEGEPSLKENRLTEPIDPPRWWGIEVISPPMSVSKQWQQEIEMVYKGISTTFDIWTDEYCSCHVHVSPGPTKAKENDYSLPQLVRMAKGAYFWEKALCDFLPLDRRWNKYAWPNYAVFGGDEFNAVPRAGWGPLFAKLDGLAAGRDGQRNFLQEIRGGERYETRYTSTSFCAFKDIGTVEFRRQAGVASPMTTIRRILLAVTLHLSCLRYDFDGAKSRMTYPTSEELRKELAGCIKKLPETCHGTRFLYWLNACLEDYKDGKTFSEEQINAYEEALRKGKPPPNQTSSLPPEPPTPTPAPGAQASSTPSQTPARGPASQGRQTPAAGRGSASRDAAPPAAAQSRRPPAGRGGAAPQGAAGRGSTGRNNATGPPAPTARPPAGRGGGSGLPAAPQGTAGTGGSGSGARPPAPRTGGTTTTTTTTRLPERPAASSSASSSRPAASTSNTGGGAPPRRRQGANDTQGQ
ncbi:hypothetical protein B0I37DRAFT_306130 [Chaetomium sp. MPI-CAGE-AT-0009]|nr:hypothetical protein B0I37DRAFT_306130 [Chaetomium sp. MPI-CAGE-AT-0009]